ncbi:decaprenylphospho-beta-D-erythro-pentofuranosid-2-ulose 2-reductase [Oryzihumus sp.]|uniref:decaprenylphospho-beta-D-erythro-pentofuranosid- 2-ulose 2-reductase n=1 Tax=Oryzihumus sp. TaxID=1968903 RepID=UPI002EDAD3F8
MKDATGNVQRVLLLGGTSEIALATAERLLARRRGVHVTLAARPGPRRSTAAAALAARGAQVDEVDFDAGESRTWQSAVEAAFTGGDVDVAVVAAGVLGDPERAWQDLDAALAMVQVNYTAAVGCGVLLAGAMRAQGHGTIVALSSVAGERPRRSNFVYGSTKAGMDAFFTGLGDAVRDDGVHVLVVRPGFVRTAMTAGLAPAPLAQDPAQVAEVIVSAIDAGQDTVWSPAVLRWVMSVLRHLPRAVFRRLPV